MGFVVPEKRSQEFLEQENLGLIRVVKALVWKLRVEPTASKVSVFLSDATLAHADDLEVTVWSQKDPWGRSIVVEQPDRSAENALRDAFTQENGDVRLPSPETLKRAYKYLTGQDLA